MVNTTKHISVCRSIIYVLSVQTTIPALRIVHPIKTLNHRLVIVHINTHDHKNAYSLRRCPCKWRIPMPSKSKANDCALCVRVTAFMFTPKILFFVRFLSYTMKRALLVHTLRTRTQSVITEGPLVGTILLVLNTWCAWIAMSSKRALDVSLIYHSHIWNTSNYRHCTLVINRIGNIVATKRPNVYFRDLLSNKMSIWMIQNCTPGGKCFDSTNLFINSRWKRFFIS